MLHCFVRSLPLAIAIILLGYLISHLLLGKPQLLDFILFVLGAIPIILFSPSLFSQSKSGAIHTPKVIFRKVETSAVKESDNAEEIFPALSCVLAGVLTWLFSLLIF